MINSVTTSAASPQAAAPVAVENTPAFWPHVALEAWMLARDPSAVEAICRARSPVDKASILLSCRIHSDKTIQAVRREIKRDMRSGKVPARGDRGHGCETVPPEDLCKAFEYCPETCTYKVGRFENLGISRDEALKWWPPAAVQVDPDRLEVGPDAISQPEFETKAADVQREPEAIRPVEGAMIECVRESSEEPAEEIRAVQDEPSRQPEDVPVEEAPAEVAGAQVAPASKKAKPPRGYVLDDEPLVSEIINRVETGKSSSLWDAAQPVARDAKGNGTPDSKARRLHRRAMAEWLSLR